mgnify:CR=1 FL=1
MKFKFFFSYTALIAILIFIVSCNESADNLLKQDPVLSEEIENPSYGGEIKLMVPQIHRNLLPSAIEETVGHRIISQTHNSLLNLNSKNLKVEPCVAKSWDVNDDQNKYTFHLRNNVFFHENSCFPTKASSKLSATDIVFTFEKLCGSLYNSGYNLLLNNLEGAKEFNSNTADKISGIEILNDSTITFKLLKPVPSFIHLLASTKTSILSKIAFKKYGSSLTVGCGPFVFSEISNDSSRIFLTKNKHYFKKDKQGKELPYLDSITLIINKDNIDPTSYFIDEKIILLRDLTEDKVEKLFVNYNDKFKNKEFILDRKAVLATDCYEFNVSKAPFDDVNVRKAFSFAVNRKSIIENILNNQGTAGAKGIVPIVETFKNYNYDSIPSSYYNPEMAKKFLASAGYPNGEGFPEVVLEVNDRKTIELDVAKEVQNQINNVLNVRITIEQKKQNDIRERAANGKTQMAHFTWISEYPSPIDFLNLFYGAENPENLDSYTWPNISRFENDEYDKILEKAMVTTDLKKRFELYSKAESLLMDKAPLLVLWYPEVYNIVQGFVKNLNFNEMLYYDYTNVYIKK